MTEADVRLAGIGEVPADYRHHPKRIEPGEDLALPDAYLKWYEVRKHDAVVTDEIRAEAAGFIRAEAESGRLDISGELGFAILHLCGESFYFLIVCTWRHANEMWETVYTKDAAGTEPFELVPQVTRMEVVCVWELGAVLHEQQAWTRFLYSDRDEKAKLEYIADRFTGEA